MAYFNMIVLYISVSLTLLSNLLVESQLLNDHLCSKQNENEDKDQSIINILVSQCVQNSQTIYLFSRNCFIKQIVKSDCSIQAYLKDNKELCSNNIVNFDPKNNSIQCLNTCQENSVLATNIISNSIDSNSNLIDKLFLDNIIDVSNISNSFTTCISCINYIYNFNNNDYCVLCGANYFINPYSLSCESCPADKTSLPYSLDNIFDSLDLNTKNKEYFQKRFCSDKLNCTVYDYLDTIVHESNIPKEQCINNQREYKLDKVEDYSHKHNVTLPVEMDCLLISNNFDVKKLSFANSIIKKDESGIFENCYESGCNNGFYRNRNYKCEQCPIGEFFNKTTSKCYKCDKNSVSIKNLDLLEDISYFDKNECKLISNQNKSVIPDSNCHFSNTLNKDYKFFLIKNNYLYSAIDLPENTILTLEKEFSIVSFIDNYLEIDFEAKIFQRNDYEHTNLFINNIEIIPSTKNIFNFTLFTEEDTDNTGKKEYIEVREDFKQHCFIVKVNKENKITIRLEQYKFDNYSRLPYLIIHKFFLRGSDQGILEDCFKCEGNTVPLDSQDCSTCLDGSFPDPKTNKCFECKRDSRSNTCVECPKLTSILRDSNNDNTSGTKKTIDSCVLTENIKIESRHISVYLSKLKSKIQELCGENNELCYNSNKFIGPLGKQNSLFFVSLFEASRINITDFSYFTHKKEHQDKGHVFALLNLNKENIKLVEDNRKDDDNTDDSVSNDSSESTVNIFFNSTNVNSRVKHMINIGSEINYVKVLPMLNITYSYNDKNTRELFSNDKSKISLTNINGLVIHYNNGDKCLNNNKLNYSSIIFLMCSSKVYNSIPSFKVYDDATCTHYFIWLSRHACQYCSKSKISSNTIRESVCSANKVFFSYKEPNYCRIRSIYEDNEIKNKEKELGSRESQRSHSSKFYSNTNNSEIFNLNEIKDHQSKINYLLKNLIVASNTKSPDNLDIEFSLENTIYNSNKIFEEDIILNQIYSRECSEDEITVENKNKILYKVVFPIFYVLTILFVYCVYKKYQKAKEAFASLKAKLELQIRDKNNRNERTNNNIENKNSQNDNSVSNEMSVMHEDNTLNLEEDAFSEISNHDNTNMNSIRDNSEYHENSDNNENNKRKKKTNPYLGKINVF